MKEKGLSVEVSVVDVGIFNNIFDKIKELLTDERIDREVREKYYQELSQLIQSYNPKQDESLEEERVKIDKMFN